MPQRQDAGDALAVVELPRMRALVGGAGVVGAVDLLAQGAGIGVGQQGLHHRALERGQPTLLALVLRLPAQHLAGRGRQAGQFRFRQRPGPGIGGIKHGFLETGFQLAQLGLDGLEARALRLLQGDAAEAETAQAVFHQGAPGAVQRAEVRRFAQRLHRLVEAAMLAQLGGVFGQFLDGGAIGLAQFR